MKKEYRLFRVILIAVAVVTVVAVALVVIHAPGGGKKSQGTQQQSIRCTRPSLSQRIRSCGLFLLSMDYNLESTRAVQLLISESQEITSYNSHTNKYYVTIPKESAVIVRTVEKIDAETLNQLTCEEIDRL